VETPKALANFSPGFEDENPGITIYRSDGTLKGFANRGTLSGFNAFFIRDPRVVAGAPTLG